jgi:phosphoribosylanthranilate isomerase
VTRIKICGLGDQSDLDHALKAGADAVGFVVEVERSRHCITAAAARDLIRNVPIFVKSVAVISPHDIDEAVRLSHETNADLLQVHSTLCAEDIRALKGLVPQKIIVASPAESEEVLAMATVADAVLLDTYKDGMLGGSGVAHDWNVSAALARRLSVPVILAGGLRPENVCEAVRKVRPYAVDVSSGVETDGRKDALKMRAFVSGVKSCL